MSLDDISTKIAAANDQRDKLRDDLVASVHQLDCEAIKTAALAGLGLQVATYMTGITPENKEIREGLINAARRQMEKIKRWTDPRAELPR